MKRGKLRVLFFFGGKNQTTDSSDAEVEPHDGSRGT